MSRLSGRSPYRREPRPRCRIDGRRSVALRLENRFEAAEGKSAKANDKRRDHSYAGQSRPAGAAGTIPSGRVTTFDVLAESLGQPPALVHLMLSGLTEDERDFAPWHRVVAKGGAIGRGLHRDQQFARLVREGIPVSPAAIVQDMPRILVTTFDARQPEQKSQPKPRPCRPNCNTAHAA